MVRKGRGKEAAPASRKTEKITFLSRFQKLAIVYVWRRVVNRAQFGQNVYTHIFMHKPVLKGLLPYRESPEQELKNNQLFLLQANMFADFVDAVVETVSADNEAVLKRLCLNVGAWQQHMAGPSFRQDWWTLFPSSVLDGLREYCEVRFLSCLNVCLSKKMLSAWEALFKYVVKMMTVGFTAARLVTYDVITNDQATDVEHRRSTSLCNLPGNVEVFGQRSGHGCCAERSKTAPASWFRSRSDANTRE